MKYKNKILLKNNANEPEKGKQDLSQLFTLYIQTILFVHTIKILTKNLNNIY